MLCERSAALDPARLAFRGVLEERAVRECMGCLQPRQVISRASATCKHRMNKGVKDVSADIRAV